MCMDVGIVFIGTIVIPFHYLVLTSRAHPVSRNETTTKAETAIYSIYIAYCVICDFIIVGSIDLKLLLIFWFQCLDSGKICLPLISSIEIIFWNIEEDNVKIFPLQIAFYYEVKWKEIPRNLSKCFHWRASYYSSKITSIYFYIYVAGGGQKIYSWSNHTFDLIMYFIFQRGEKDRVIG